MATHPQPPTRRAPLGPIGDSSRRVNNSQHSSSRKDKPSIPHHESLAVKHNIGTGYDGQGSYQRRPAQNGLEVPNPVNPRLSAIAAEYPVSNRDSQISTSSTSSDKTGKLKAYIGPWRLGKTLGMGATARVRLARHMGTGQVAAIKIVQKKHAQISQAGSLAALDRAIQKTPEEEDGLRRMPVGIEREVAIMKLIQHPNIMKLYDIWENRTEIYLVLEYVENGELFDHIAQTGKLSEKEALRCFRQVLSAVGYCHSLNICHRDLKPENILLTKDGQIKIADFGMAALQQGPDHKLITSCGSPHYAAPELIKGAAYRGNMVDIWSMGVILYATLAGRLPFDVEGATNKFLAPLLAKIKKGHYEMAPDFSPEAKSLIRRMLQVNPSDRIALSQIWNHPLLKKYDYLDNLGTGEYPQSPSVNQCGRPVTRRGEICKDILYGLRTMWHTLSEQQLIDALLSEMPNEQKLFYSLLVQYRDEQLENYAPDIGYSTSDYHHVPRRALTKTYSTCHFPATKSSNGHGRQASKFTVISNMAETERSYDPFKASRPQHLQASRNDRATVIIHRKNESSKAISFNKIVRQATRAAPTKTATKDSTQQTLAPPGQSTKVHASRSSMASSTRSRGSNPYVRATVGNRRGVSFAHLRQHSLGSSQKLAKGLNTPTRTSRHSNHTEVTDDGGSVLRAVNSTDTSAQYIRSKKEHPPISRSLPSPGKQGRASLIWGEDVRQLSSSLAKDCDEAFNRISALSSEELSNREEANPGSLAQARISDNPFRPANISNQLQIPVLNLKKKSLNSRPLPPVPARTESLEIELLAAKKQAELRRLSGDDDSPEHTRRVVSHLDRLMQASSSSRDQRTSSAPTDARRTASGRRLPSIYETQGEGSSPPKDNGTGSSSFYSHRLETKNGRVASAPEPRETEKLHRQDRSLRQNSMERDTIRVVNSTSFESPVKVPAPLVIRKNASKDSPALMPGGLGGHPQTSNWRRPSGSGLRDQYKAIENHEDLAPIDEDRMDEDESTNESNGTIVKTKSGWLKRDSKSKEDSLEVSVAESVVSSKSQRDDTQTPFMRPANPHLISPPTNSSKKKGFNLGRLFKKRSSKPDLNPDMVVVENNAFDDNASAQDSIMEYQHSDGRFREIAPQRNWLAKLFNIKPPARYICFTTTQRKARKVIVSLLRDWKRYGIKDIHVDKARSVVFAKVGVQNFLSMKEVAFAAEVFTVYERTKYRVYNYSVARFTQEHGAASSFAKVIETLEAVFKCRQILVTDERKKRMLVKSMVAQERGEGPFLL